ncbi:BRCA2 repeat family protein [Planoprotostelium fungivorum]|uniref:BRCA2 repeat family protein n=1 Tax=Planoprotostelium fungivorum TaxID=1890364 RepID=A0A2P6NUN6_9EUKA|nr:BRCA2 repeat family protein [Planoprotostelium fungivorum]
MKRRKVTAFSSPFKKTNTNNETKNDRDGSAECDGTQTADLTTGRGQKISRSTENMNKARKLLDENTDTAPVTPMKAKRTEKSLRSSTPDKDMDTTTTSPRHNETTPQGFTTGGGKKLSAPSATAMAKAQGLLDSTETSEPVSKEIPKAVGFSTGSGKRVSPPTAASLAKAQNMMMDVDANDATVTPTTNGFSTGRGKKMSPPTAASLAKAQNMMEGDIGDAVPPIATGFSTGGGRKLKPPTAASLAKAQGLLKSVKGDGGPTTDDPSIQKNSSPSSSTHATRRQEDKQKEDTDVPIDVGFSTGRGKKMSAPTAASVAKARSMMDKEDADTPPLVSTGFSTAGGKKMKPPSATSLAKAQNMMTEVNSGELDATTPVGFSTGGGKKIQPPSAESVEKAKSIMRDEGDPLQPAITVGFSTGGGKKMIAPSAASLAKAQSMMKEGEEKVEENTLDVPVTVGFSTGGGKKMKPPSAASLAKATNMMTEETKETQANGSQSLSQPDDSQSTDALALLEFDSTQSSQKKIELPPTDDLEDIDEGQLDDLFSTEKKAGTATPVTPKAGKRFVYPTTPNGRVSITPKKSSLGNKPMTPLKTPRKLSEPYSPAKKAFTAPRMNLEKSPTAVSPYLQRKRQRLEETTTPKKVEKKVEVQTNKVSLREFEKSYPMTNRTMMELMSPPFSIPSFVLSMTSESARNFQFPPNYEEGEESSIGPPELLLSLTRSGCDPRYISIVWVQNHYRWIVWKLSCLERSFPQALGNRLVLPSSVLSQMRHRYEREVERAERSVLRKICERDESSSKHMVLCVATVKSDGSSNIIEVTDGWYSLNAALDEPLNEQLKKGKIYPGLKLRVFGAQIDGLENGLPPLEAKNSAVLKFFFNGVRRAPWYAKLGLQRSMTFPVNLRSISASGGMIPCVQVVVQRKYPRLFREVLGDNTVIIRDVKEEELADIAHSRKREDTLSKTSVQILKQMREEELEAVNPPLQPGGFRLRQKKKSEELSQMNNGQELYDEMLRRKLEPADFLEKLSKSQKEEFISFHEGKETEKKQRFHSELGDAAVETKRNVTEMIRIKLTDCPTGNVTDASHAVLTLWRPPEELLSGVNEGQVYKIYGLLPSKSQTGEHLLLNSSNAMRWEKLKVVPPIYNDIYHPRKITKISELSESNKNAEVDVVGCLLYVDKQEGPVSFYNAYICDTSLRLAMIHFRSGGHLQPAMQKIRGNTFLTVSATNVVNKGRDNHHGVERLLGTDVSQVTSARGPQYVRRELEELDKWMTSSGIFEELSGLKEYASALSRGESPCLPRCLQITMREQKQKSLDEYWKKGEGELDITEEEADAALEAAMKMMREKTDR